SPNDAFCLTRGPLKVSTELATFRLGSLMRSYPIISRLSAVGVMTGLALVAATPARAVPALNRFREFHASTTGSYPTDIATGPDGNLWFTEARGNKIGRITTDGVITEFHVPTPGSFPVGIAAGPDGNLWFA